MGRIGRTEIYLIWANFGITEMCSGLIDIQSPSNAYKRSPVYAMKPATFNMIFHSVRVQPRC